MAAACATLLIDGGGGGGDEFNVVIESFSLSPSQITLGQTCSFTATARNTGTLGSPTGLVVQLLVDGTVAASTTLPSIPAGGEVPLSGNISPNQEGVFNICIQLQTKPADRLCQTLTVSGGSTPDCTEGTYRCLGYTRQKCVGGQWTDYEQNSPDCGYPTPECTDGETRCDGTTLQHCYNGTWVDIEENSPSCTEPEPGSWLDYLKEHAVGIGLLSIAAIGGLGIMMTQKKKY